MTTGQGHVLVVDDAAELRVLFAAILEDAGYRVTLCDSAPAVEEVAAIGPDLVVLDLLLGGDEGAAWGLVEAMRADARLQAVPVVICSAATDLLRRLDERFAAMGIAALGKPFELEEFLATVARLAGGSAAD
ncbi:MAG: response regulator transcription factor [Chloroflexia bacterium]|nr:response regulator transcription factor [Chloroflexia bacterium]